MIPCKGASNLPFGYDREPPRVSPEFREALVPTKKGRTPKEDVESDALTLIKAVGENSEDVIADGKAWAFSFTPSPRYLGEFSSANILVGNLKSRHRPFTIAKPYGIRTQPYKLDDPRADGFHWSPPVPRQAG